MLSSRRLIIAGACAALLASCGFTPVYGPDGSGTALRGTIRAAEPDGDFGFAFVRRFEERLGLPEAERYDLTYSVETEGTDLAIDGSNNITRFNIEGTLTWALTPSGGDAPVLTGAETTFTSYSATGSTISTLESERDAERRLAVILADAVVTRLLGEAGSL